MLATPIEVKKAYKEGTHKKNYRFVVLNDDGTEDFTIDNDTLVAESVHIDERMATGSELKFGLCEGSSLEFQYFDHPNINGRQVQAFIDIYYDDVNTHSTPMGFFTVKECSRQFSTGIYKATAYNKLQSDYLDQKANEGIVEEFQHEDTVLMLDILETMLNGYGIKTYTKTPIDESTGSMSNPLTTPTYGYGYTTRGSDQGAFGPAIIYKKQTTSISSGLYMQFPQNRSFPYRDWYLNFNRDAIIQIRFDEDLSQIDENIYNFVNSELGKIRSNDVPATFLDDYLSGIGFIQVTIFYQDNTYEYYSTSRYNHLNNPATYNCVGTLDDLNKITITKPIHSIGISIVDAWAFGKLSSGDVSIVNDDSPHSNVSNVVYFTGDQKEYVYIDQSNNYQYSTYTPPKYKNNVLDTASILDWVHVYEVTDVDEADLVEVDPESIQDVTLRELQSAVFETACQYGQLDRVTDLFSGVELNGGGLYPAETLYPANGLYPNNGTGGQGIHPYPSEYSQLWTDTMGEQSFRYLIITYKTLDENNNEVDAVLQRTVNADGTTDYNMSDNWLFRNLVWTAADVGDYADAMVLKMHNIRWFPFEMWAAGLPYVETGDAIEITDREGNTHNSYILQRQLQGIQNLQDTYVNGELDIF